MQNMFGLCVLKIVLLSSCIAISAADQDSTIHATSSGGSDPHLDDVHPIIGGTGSYVLYGGKAVYADTKLIVSAAEGEMVHGDNLAEIEDIAITAVKELPELPKSFWLDSQNQEAGCQVLEITGAGKMYKVSKSDCDSLHGTLYKAAPARALESDGENRTVPREML